VVGVGLSVGSGWLVASVVGVAMILAERDVEGVREITAARLDEVSLVDRAQLAPLTYATLRDAPPAHHS
jgi:hypothetical protein